MKTQKQQQERQHSKNIPTKVSLSPAGEKATSITHPLHSNSASTWKFGKSKIRTKISLRSRAGARSTYRAEISIFKRRVIAIIAINPRQISWDHTTPEVGATGGNHRIVGVPVYGHDGGFVFRNHLGDPPVVGFLKSMKREEVSLYKAESPATKHITTAVPANWNALSSTGYRKFVTCAHRTKK